LGSGKHLSRRVKMQVSREPIGCPTHQAQSNLGRHEPQEIDWRPVARPSQLGNRLCRARLLAKHARKRETVCRFRRVAIVGTVFLRSAEGCFRRCEVGLQEGNLASECRSMRGHWMPRRKRSMGRLKEV